ncbi:hypothetical protein ACTG9Q_29560 [Actinokineospora sp. 24-640]
MSRIFWIGVGLATGVALSRKARRTAHAVTPAGVAENVGDAVRELAGALGAFGADVRAGMTEREGELADMVERRSGVESRRPAERRGTARARRADDRA